LQRLQQLTHLELASIKLQGPDQGANALQPLQALTGLVDLQLVATAGVQFGDEDIPTASILAGMHRLTCLALHGCKMEPGVLADKTQLQRLDCFMVSISGGATGVSQLLSNLQHMQQLTTLYLAYTLRTVEEASPPAAAYSALTASSKLVDLVLTRSRLPAGAWQHVFPTGRQLPHLQELKISWCRQYQQDDASAPDGSRLVSCCPGLQTLHMQGLPYSAEWLTALQRLSELHTLYIDSCEAPQEGARRVGQLTGLRNLSWEREEDPSGQRVLLPLTQLKQLRALTAFRAGDTVELSCKVSLTETRGLHVCHACLLAP
jgi:hypothetical protein